MRAHVRRLESFPSRVIRSWVCLSGNVCATSQGVVRFLDPDGSIPKDKIAYDEFRHRGVLRGSFKCPSRPRRPVPHLSRHVSRKR